MTIYYFALPNMTVGALIRLHCVKKQQIGSFIKNKNLLPTALGATKFKTEMPTGLLLMKASVCLQHGTLRLVREAIISQQALPLNTMTVINFQHMNFERNTLNIPAVESS